MFICLILLVLCVAIYIGSMLYDSYNHKQKYFTFICYNPYLIRIFRKYVSSHLVGNTVNIEDIFIKGIDKIYINLAAIDIKINFKDINSEVEGYYYNRIPTREMTSLDDNIIDNYIYIEIHILNNNNANIRNIYKHIFKTSLLNKKYDKLNIFDQTDGRNSVYKTRKSTRTNEFIYMNTFFHEKKYQVLESIKVITGKKKYCSLEERFSNINFLLHGPSGCGKSSFIYKLTMCLNLNIHSISLCALNNCEELKSILDNSTMINEIIIFEDLDDMIENSVCNHENATFSIDDLINLLDEDKPGFPMISISVIKNYDRIKMICPELFNSKNFNDIYFGYVTDTILQEMCMFYFSKEINQSIPDDINIPTSTIVLLALESDGDFDLFKSKLIELF